LFPTISPSPSPSAATAPGSAAAGSAKGARADARAALAASQTGTGWRANLLGVTIVLAALVSWVSLDMIRRLKGKRRAH
jgi:hypothetical protein